MEWSHDVAQAPGGGDVGARTTGRGTGECLVEWVHDVTSGLV